MTRTSKKIRYDLQMKNGARWIDAHMESDSQHSLSSDLKRYRDTDGKNVWGMIRVTTETTTTVTEKVVDYSKYPKDWKRISQSIRERSGGRCECHGECGLHRTTGGPRRCCEQNGQPAKWAKGKIVLTVAHLNHDPMDCRPENLKAMCQRCHLRYDVDHHKKNSAETRRKKIEKTQPSLPLFL